MNADKTARLILPELLDHAPPVDALPSLRDLVRINRFLGGYRTLRWLMRQVANPSDSFSLLDIGSASGDMGRVIRQSFPRASVTSFDYRWDHLAGAASPKLVGDAFALPFAKSSFDFVFSSLFLHHFEDNQVVDLLNRFAGVARKAVLAIDLERGPLAYRFIPATKWLFGWHPITLHDAPVSVQAAFQRGELIALAQRAGLTAATVRVHRPWSRVSLIGVLS
ncbi:MAG: methyltransferase domain-containing protein [Bryobacteraceae bacterium]